MTNKAIKMKMGSKNSNHREDCKIKIMEKTNRRTAANNQYVTLSKLKMS